MGMLRAGYPTLRSWRGGTIYLGSRPAGVITRSPRMVTECLLAPSMLIKMYLPLRDMLQRKMKFCVYVYTPNVSFFVFVFTFLRRSRDFRANC